VRGSPGKRQSEPKVSDARRLWPGGRACPADRLAVPLARQAIEFERSRLLKPDFHAYQYYNKRYALQPQVLPFCITLF